MAGDENRREAWTAVQGRLIAVCKEVCAHDKKVIKDDVTFKDETHAVKIPFSPSGLLTWF